VGWVSTCVDPIISALDTGTGHIVQGRGEQGICENAADDIRPAERRLLHASNIRCYTSVTTAETWFVGPKGHLLGSSASPGTGSDGRFCLCSLKLTQTTQAVADFLLSWEARDRQQLP
jgi:hypothetical protein